MTEENSGWVVWKVVDSRKKDGYIYRSRRSSKGVIVHTVEMIDEEVGFFETIKDQARRFNIIKDFIIKD